MVPTPARTPTGPTSAPPTVAQPGAPPPRPTGDIQPRAEDIVFKVERPGGVFKRFEDGPGQDVFVMTGNPRIQGFEHTRPDGVVVPPLSLKANRMVLWVDSERFAEMGLLGADLSGDEAGQEGGTTTTRKKKEGGESESLEAWTLLQEAVKGIYAEGAVELTYGTLSFRAKRVYVEPGENKALLIEPAFTGTVRGEGMRDTDLPFHVRARQARIVSAGVAIFEDADAGTSRASDRFEVRVKTLKVEEVQDLAEGGAVSERKPGDVTLLGFRDLSSQTYEAFDAQVRGERIPVGYWPHAELGYPDGDRYPYRISEFGYGNRTSLGRYLILGISGPIGNQRDRFATWTATLSGYTDRGPAGGGAIDWNRDWGYGHVSGWGIADYDGKDFNGYVAPETFRWMVNAESRTYLSDHWSVDAEFHDFADEGVNLQFFENDQLTHKDYESYVRPRAEYGTFVGTLMGKWHQRDFVTETTQLPQLQLAFTSIPLRTGGGGPSIDVSSWNRAGYLERRFAVGDPSQDYAAARLQTDTRLNVAFDAGDVRISTFGGLYAANYFERTDDAPDLTRAAFTGGARANLQLHKLYPARGGIFQLNRLRHVIDLDLEAVGIYFAEDNLAEVPYFDLTDDLEERSTGILRIRNRLQTRGRDGGTRDVIDLELSGLYYVDDVGPYGIRVPGEIDYVLRGQPRENWLIAGEGRWDVGDSELYRGSFGIGAVPNERLAVFTGIRYLRDEALAPLIDVGWRFSEKYGIRVRDIYDFRAQENNLRLVLGRYSADHAIFFGVTQIGTDYGFKLDVTPTFGASSASGLYRFTDLPDPDPWGNAR